MLINTCSVYKTENHIHEGMHFCQLCFYSVWVHIIESKMVNQKQNEDEFFHIHNIYTTYIQRMNYYQNQLLDTWKCVSLGVPLSNLFFSLFDSIFNTKKYAPASDEQSWLSRAILWRWILIYLILKPNLFSTHRFKIKTLCIFKESLKKNYLNIYFCRWINEFRFFTRF